MSHSWCHMFYLRLVPGQLSEDSSWLCSLLKTAFQIGLGVLLCSRQLFIAILLAFCWRQLSLVETVLSASKNSKNSLDSSWVF